MFFHKAQTNNSASAEPECHTSEVYDKQIHTSAVILTPTKDHVQLCDSFSILFNHIHQEEYRTFDYILFFKLKCMHNSYSCFIHESVSINTERMVTGLKVNLAQRKESVNTGEPKTNIMITCLMDC